MAKSYKIHPPIGIARVGNSTEFFLGSELPGTFARPTDGKYRDAGKKLRRQAARFWVFEYDDANPGAAPQPVFVGTGGVARIEWTVHLVNKKSVWFNFDGIKGEGPGGYLSDHLLRNAHITNVAERRKKLIIDPRPRTVTAVSTKVEVSKGTSATPADETWPGPLTGGKEITSLGTLETDAQGRLSVAGGLGTSGTTGALPGNGELKYDNNDRWFDDVADGSVTARVVFGNGTSFEAASAWVIVGPPDYAPPIENLVTLHDLLYDLGLREFGLDPAVFDPVTKQFKASYKPSFTREIYPVLRRAYDFRWVIKEAAQHPPTMKDFAELGASPTAGEDPEENPRVQVFLRLRDPDHLMATRPPGEPQPNMPRLHNDGIGGVSPESLSFSVTRTQYALLKKWAAGQFIPDWTGPPAAATTVTAAGLDRAALDAACGGSFFPGMEASWNLRDPRVYAKPFDFRFRLTTSETDPNGVTPGDVTKRSALPWQADFLKCADNWWPAQRPNQVRPNATAGSSLNWIRGVTTGATSEVGTKHTDLVDKWPLLAIVIPTANAAGAVKFHESERELP